MPRYQAVITDESYTPAQAAFFAANEHLVPVERLSDGDLLCLDKSKWGVDHTDTHHGEHYGPYILTTEGNVNGVTEHYQNRHGANL